ncbi:MAG: TonB-dependent receptor [Acidobacteria bacterium]|nr:TonB-dependent receptor [Acidobacteriota bacterium]
MRKFTPILILVAICLLATGPAAVAQTTGSITGAVNDNDGKPLPGVTVEATSPALQGTRVVVTSGNGTYRFPSLSPGTYTVKATLSGFSTAERSVPVTLDATATVNLTMRITAKEEVVVSGEAPLVDVTNTTTGSSYSAKVIERLPVARNYADIVRSNPGVNTDRGETQGRALALTVYGATSVENQYVIDGVNTTNVIKGFQGKSINTEFIQEVEVKTGGYQAEYGRALGGVINVITKSGGNEFHGDAFGYYDSFKTQSDRKITPQDSLTGMVISDYKRTDFGADVGGFIFKDHLWFFAAFDRVNNPGTVSRAVASSAIPTSAKFKLDETDNLYSGKLTWNIAQGSTLVATAFADPTIIEGAANADPRHARVASITSFDPRTYESRRDVGGQDGGLRFNQLFGSLGLLTLQASHHEDRYQLTPSGAGSGIRVDDFTCTGGTATTPCVQPASSRSTTGGFGQIFGPTRNNRSNRNQYRGDLAFYFGTHEVKAGGDYEIGKTTAITYYTGGQQVTKLNEYGQTYYEHDFFSAGASSQDPIDNTVTPKSINYGAYFQDSWKVIPGLTFNAGIRWDQEDVQDYTGTTAIKTKNEWQPRVGVIWDPKGNGAAKIYGFFGRFYYAIPTDLNVRAYGAQTQVTTFNFDPINTHQDAAVIGHSKPFVQGGAFTEPSEAGIKGIYQDEFTIGGEMLLDPTLSVGIKGTYRNLGQVIEDRCDLDGERAETNFNTCALINPGSSGAISRGAIPGCNGLDGKAAACGESIPATPRARRIYRGIELVGRKSFSQTFWAQASYVFSSLRGNYDGEVREGRGQTDPGINADFDYAAFNVNNYGKLFLDRPHNLRLDLSYTTPFKLFVGLQTYVQSGAPLNKQGYFNSGYGAEVQLVERGSAKRLPATYEANLTLGYPIALGPVTVTLQAYVFNLLNRQTETLEDVRFSTSQPANYPASLFDPNQQQTNSNFGKITQRQDPRLFRGSIKVAF